MSNPLGVIPDDLDKFAATLRDRAGDATQAAQYCRQWLSPGGSAPGGIYTETVALINDAREVLVHNYERLAAIADGSGSEVVATAQHYRLLDGDLAARVEQAGR